MKPSRYEREQQLLSSIRVLIADDFEAWRRQVRSLFQARPEWQVMAEAVDGPEAIQKAEELKPDLIVLATKSHRDSLLQRLKRGGVNADSALRQGTYISLDAADTLSTIMLNGLPDPDRFFRGIGGFIEAAAKAAKSGQPRVVAFGEAVALLQAEGNADAAIRFEQLGNDLTKMHEVDILCAYPL